jgi:hypothetical protein
MVLWLLLRSSTKVECLPHVATAKPPHTIWKSSMLLEMTTAIYIDSRWRASGSSSDFKYELAESLNLHGARLRVDAIRFTDSFYTIEEENRRLYFKGAGNTLDVYYLPIMAYTGVRLAAQLQFMTSRTCSFSDLTGDLTMANIAASPLLNDDQLRAYPSNLFMDASPTDPKSCNNILGPGDVSEDGSQIVFHFISMAPYQDLYLRSSALACKGVRGPAHTHDILCKIPLTQGIGRVVTGETSSGVFYDLPQTLSLRTLDFRLTDHRGLPVNLRGGSLSFELVFD